MSDGRRTTRLSVVPRSLGAGEIPDNGVEHACIRVIVVGGHQLFLDSLAIALGSYPSIEIVGTEPDVLEARACIHRTQPDVVLYNHFLAEGDCAEAVAELRTDAPDLKVIVLTSAKDDQESLFACVQAGASGHQTTDRQPTELVDSIKRVYAGEKVFSPDLLLNLMTRAGDRSSAARAVDLPIPQLAPRELQVLQTVASGMSTGEAASTLGITVHTVRAHLKNVMTKLQAHSKLEAVIFALKRGLIQLPE